MPKLSKLLASQLVFCAVFYLCYLCNWWMPISKFNFDFNWNFQLASKLEQVLFQVQQIDFWLHQL